MVGICSQMIVDDSSRDVAMATNFMAKFSFLIIVSCFLLCALIKPTLLSAFQRTNILYRIALCRIE